MRELASSSSPSTPVPSAAAGGGGNLGSPVVSPLMNMIDIMLLALGDVPDSDVWASVRASLCASVRASRLQAHTYMYAYVCMHVSIYAYRYVRAIVVHVYVLLCSAPSFSVVCV